MVIRFCSSYHQKKRGWIKAIRSHHSEHCVFVLLSTEKERQASIHPGSTWNHDCDDSSAFIVVDYVRQEAKSFFIDPYLYLADVLPVYREYSTGLWICTHHEYTAFYSRTHELLWWVDQDGWMRLVLAGATVLNANCFEGHRIHWLLW